MLDPTTIGLVTIFSTLLIILTNKIYILIHTLLPLEFFQRNLIYLFLFYN